jgi:ribosomal protein S18 acetylase RimI-like enzyme
MDVIIDENGNFAVAELNELFSTNHWEVTDTALLENSVRNSWYWLTARTEADKLIGFVQAISDGIRHVYILKLIVHPDYRHNGVATRIMKTLMKTITDRKMLPTLVATPGNASFYEQFGFRTESKGLIAMCIR